MGVRSSAVDAPRKDTKPAEHNGSADRMEEIKTPDSLEESQGEDVGKVDRSDSKGSPQGGRRYGVQMMGSGLLAEMKAKQEMKAKAACSLKVRGGGVSFDLLAFVIFISTQFLWARQVQENSLWV